MSGGEPTKVKCNHISAYVITFEEMFLHLKNYDPISPNGANVITSKYDYIYSLYFSNVFKFTDF